MYKSASVQAHGNIISVGANPMACKSKPLRGCSELIRSDGTAAPVRDHTGNLLIDPDEWEHTKRQIVKNISCMVSDIVTQHPERKTAFGIPAEQTQATVRLLDLLQGKENTPTELADTCQ